MTTCRCRLLVLLLLVLGLPALVHAFTIAELHTELTTDPKQLGYQGNIDTGNDVALVEQINLVRTGQDYQINRGIISSAALVPELVIADLTALLSGTPPKMPILQLYLSVPQLDTADPEVQAVFLNLFPAGSPSRTNLLAFFKRQGSRSEVLWGQGFVVTLDQVSCALRGANC